MNKTYLFLLIALIVVVGGVYWWWGGERNVVAPAVSPATEQQSVVPQTNPPAGGNIVSFNGAGYEPNILKIKKGETVTFKNDSATKTWPASAMHPTHTVYPTTGGCIGSTFDACRGLMPGESWQFQFDVAGTWKYHDHLDSQYFGTIIVE